MKLADSVSYRASVYKSSVLTIRGRVHDNEAGVDLSGLVPISEINGVGMATETLIRFVEMDFTAGAFQRP